MRSEFFRDALRIFPRCGYFLNEMCIFFGKAAHLFEAAPLLGIKSGSAGNKMPHFLVRRHNYHYLCGL